MSAPPKRSFTSFVKRTPDHLTETGGRHDQAQAGRPDPAQAPASHSRPADAGWPEERQPTAAQSERPEVDETGEGVMAGRGYAHPLDAFEPIPLHGACRVSRCGFRRKGGSGSSCSPSKNGGPSRRFSARPWTPTCEGEGSDGSE